MKKTVCFVLLSALSCQYALADMFDSEYESAGILSALLMTNSVQHSSNTCEWTAPEYFVSTNGVTNAVVVAGTRETPNGQSIFLDLSSTAGSAEASIHVCTNAASAIQELCFPLVAFSSMPLDMIASRFTLAETPEGLNEILVVQPALEDIDRLAMLTFGNLSIRYEGEHAHANALALLRAGGLNIPNSPPPSPNP